VGGGDGIICGLMVKWSEAYSSILHSNIKSARF